MIDIIIPAYNAHKTIETTLNSIALQTISELFTVTIVNDNGDKYTDIVESFKNRLKIKELHKRVNGGAGLARQHGIDNTKNPYIVFVDADDILPDIFAIQQLFNGISREQDCVMVSGNFLEETPNGTYSVKSNDTTWLHGKIYKRSHIEKYHIHFSDLRLCEDVEFNMKIKLYATGNEHIRFANDRYYYVWKNNRQSITRNDRDKFPYLDIVVAGVEACYRALRKTDYENVRQYRGEVMMKLMEMFNYYNLLKVDKPNEKEWLETLLESFRKFYRDIAKSVYENAPKEEIAKLFLNRDKGNVEHIIPIITFNDFIELLKQ